MQGSYLTSFVVVYIFILFPRQTTNTQKWKASLLTIENFKRNCREHFQSLGFTFFIPSTSSNQFWKGSTQHQDTLLAFLILQLLYYVGKDSSTHTANSEMLPPSRPLPPFQGSVILHSPAWAIPNNWLPHLTNLHSQLATPVPSSLSTKQLVMKRKPFFQALFLGKSFLR